MEQTFILLFWVCAALIGYVYLGYPLLLFALARRRLAPRALPDERLPRVTLLISAYNEDAVIREKLENAISLDYPSGRLEIIVISDCSEDATDRIVTSFASQGVRLIRQPKRLGKSSGLNLGVAQATGEILIFSDANAIYQRDALRLLVRHFCDERIGYVVGNARYADIPGRPPSADSEGLYWRLEGWLKRRESEFGSVVGGDGAIYAIRRELFSPLRPTDINDFLNPLQIIGRGYRGVYESAAICYEEASDSFEKEFRRKVRIVSRSLNALRRAPRVLLPWNQPRHWIALVSHKLLRWFVPALLILCALSALALWSSSVYRLAAVLQLIFYALALAGWAVEGRSRIPAILYLPYYFCLVNLAALFGIAKFGRGSLSPTWQTVRQDAPPHSSPPLPLAKRGS